MREGHPRKERKRVRKEMPELFQRRVKKTIPSSKRPRREALPRPSSPVRPSPVKESDEEWKSWLNFGKKKRLKKQNKCKNLLTDLKKVLKNF